MGFAQRHRSVEMTSNPHRLIRRFALAALLLTAGTLLLDRLFPLPLPDASGGSTVVLARDGTPLRAFPDDDGVWRYPVKAEDVSPLYIEALLTYEDRWFRRHPGVNPFALARAFAQWIAHRRVVSGGSTLTMQVARILDPQPRSLAASCARSCARCSSRRTCRSGTS